MIVVTGCGSGDEPEAADPTATLVDDTSTADLGDFPIPLPPGAVGAGTTDQGDVQVVLFTLPIEDQEAAIAFYDEWTATQPGGYQRVVAQSGGVTWQNGAAIGGESTRVISVLSPIEGDDIISVTLTATVE